MNEGHILDSGIVTAEEIEAVLSNHQGKVSKSKSSGRPIVFGWTTTGKYLAVVFEIENDPDLMIIRPVTAYSVTDED